MHPSRVKKGTFMKYKVGSVSNKWKIYQAILFSDSKLCWYEKVVITKPRKWCKRDTRSKEFVFLKDVVPYICIGTMTDRMPVKSPVLPDGYSKHHLVGIGMDRKAETVHWILFSSIAEIESWVAEIISTLPIVNQLPHRFPLSPLMLFSIPSSANGERSIMGESKALPSDCVQQSSYRSASYSSDCFDGRILDDAAFDEGFGTAMLAGALISHGLGSMWGLSGGSYSSISINAIDKDDFDRKSTTVGGTDNSTPFRTATSEVRDEGAFDHPGGHNGFDYPGVNFHSGDSGGGDHGDGLLSFGDFGNGDFNGFDFY